MEVAGLIIGFIPVILSFIQTTGTIITALERSKASSGEATQLLTEVRALSKTLLVARDVAEREGTEGGRVQTLVALTQQGRNLEALISELAVRTGQPDSRRFWHRPNQARLRPLLGEVRDNRLALEQLLSESDLSRLTDISDHPTREASSRPSAEAVAEWLGGTDFSNILQNLTKDRIPGTGSWLLEDPSFQRWIAQPGKSLWCTGQPGTGKSVLCAMGIDYLRRNLSIEKTPVIFAFFNLESRTQMLVDIVNSLISQLVQQSHHISGILTRVYNKYKSSPNSPKLEELWLCLFSEITRFDRVFIFFDALDEYHHGPEAFLDDFHYLLKITNTSLFVTSRPTFTNKRTLRDFDVLEVRAQDCDIESYVRGILSQSWLAYQPSLHDDIVKTTIEKSNGMYILARMSLDFLLSRGTMRQLKNELSTRSSPVEIYGIWIHTFILDKGEKTTLALEILLWLAYSLRPLTMKQLREAVGIRLGSDDLDKDDLPFIEVVEEVCSGLVLTGQSRQKVALVHFTLHEYLQQFLPTVMSLIPGPNEPDALIAKKCLTCLSFNAFSCDIPSKPGELEDRLARYSMLGYAARYWGEHAQRILSPNIMSDIMTFFKSSHNTLSAGLVMSTYEQHPSHYEQAYRGMLGLHISAYFGLTDVATHIITYQKVHPDATTNGGWTALHWAARRGWTPMVSTLLSYNASASKETSLDGWNALHLAAKEGHADVVLKLIETGVDVNAKDVHSRTALYLATWGGHVDVVRCLLQAPADPRISNEYGATALHCAAKRGHELIVSELLSEDIDVNAVDKVGLSALDEAMRKQNNKVIKLLNEAGAETRWNTNLLPSDSVIIHDLNWDAYRINEQRTARAQKGSQCESHVLEKASEPDSPSSPTMVFRKTFYLSAKIKEKERKNFEAEWKILHRLQHPNVVTYLDFDEDPDQNAFFLYTEYCDLGDLKTCHGRLLDEGNDGDEESEVLDHEDKYYGFYAEDPSSDGETTALDSESIWTLIAQLSLALAYLHYGLTINFRGGNWEASFESSWETIIHRDIKPANVVMQSGESYARTFKLCDLGIATEAGKGPEYNTTQWTGTLGFWPPEVNKGNVWLTKGDVWSLGATILELKKLKDSAFEISTRGIIDKCTHNFHKKRPSSLEILEEAHDLLKSNSLLERLPQPSRLQIQAAHSPLGGREGGYILQAFSLIAELLDDIVPFHNQEAKDRRKGILKQLDLLWNDGAETPFLEHLTDSSLHVLILLSLSTRIRAKYFRNVITPSRANTQWKRSRWTPLHLAIQEGNKEIEKELLDNGADKDMEDIHGHVPGYYAD